MWEEYALEYFPCIDTIIIMYFNKSLVLGEMGVVLNSFH